MSYLDEVHARATIQAAGSDARYHRVPRRYRALLVPAIAALMILGIEVAADRVEDSYQDYEPDRYGEVSP